MDSTKRQGMHSLVERASNFNHELGGSGHQGSTVGTTVYLLGWRIRSHNTQKKITKRIINITKLLLKFRTTGM